MPVSSWLSTLKIAVFCATPVHIEVTINNQGLLILACKKLDFNFIIFLIKKNMNLLCQLQAFNTKTKFAPAFKKELKTLVFIAIFLDKVGGFYNHHHLTALPLIRKSLKSISVLIKNQHLQSQLPNT